MSECFGEQSSPRGHISVQLLQYITLERDLEHAGYHTSVSSGLKGF